MTEEAPNSNKYGPALKAFVWCFIVYYIVGTAVWLWQPGPLRDQLIGPFNSVWRFIGWEQGWGVFGPRLRQVNYHTTATVTFQDGSSLLYELPRMEKMNLIEKFQKEKWRKWGNDFMSWPDCRAFWPDLARWIARQCNDPKNPPVQVALNMHSITIVPPETFVSQAKLPEHTTCSPTFIYRVKAKDLES